MPGPRVSIVVSTHDRPALLDRLLDALRAQTLDPDAIEVVVVDDGSGPGTGALLARRAGDAGLRLRHARHSRRRGPAAGRNTGWRMARGSLVAFTDDDCAPTPRWLESLLAAAQVNPASIIQGPTRPDPDGLGGSRLRAVTVENTQLGPQYQTCNIAYPRSLLEQLGGFDEQLQVGEDTDLAWRALEAGKVATFCPEALVHHAVQRLGTLAWLRSGARWGAIAPVFARHPGTRTMLHARVFWNVWHMLLIRSIAAGMTPRWLRWFVFSRHLIALLRRAEALGSGPCGVPALLIYDAVETASIVRGAVRHGTPLL